MAKLGRVGRRLLIGAMAPFCAIPVAAAQSPRSSKSTSHRLVLQVSTNDPTLMNLALNNAVNAEQYYSNLDEIIEIEIVTFGPGLHMLREDTSPVKDRIKALAKRTKRLSFRACANTQENMSRAEKKTISLVPEAITVESGVVRLVELQEQGWSAIRP